jgi:outer membrane receptor protein involved in Fe transport
MKHFFITVLLLSSCLLNGQEYQIQGSVKNQEGKPLEFVNIFLSQDTSIITGTLTDEEGKFILTAKEGAYTLKASHLYLDDHSEEVILNGNISTMTITLEEKSVELSEVLVTDFRNVTEAGIDKRVIHVSEDLKRINTSLSEILEMVSLVNMDMEGNPSIPGKQGVLVLVDGRPPRVKANDLATVLRLIPSDQILRIEIMTNPPAKYTKGNDAVINVITNRKLQKGQLFNGWANANDFGAVGLGGNYTIKRGKWGGSAWGGRWQWRSRNEYTDQRTNFNEDAFHNITESAEGKHYGYGFFGGIAPEYQFNEKNFISFNAGLYTWNNDNTRSDEVAIRNINGGLESSYTRESDEFYGGFGGYAGLEYFKYFDEKEKELTISIDANRGGNNSEGEETLFNEVGFYQLRESEEANWNIYGEVEFFDPIDSTSSLNYAMEFDHIFPYDEEVNYYSGPNSENTILGEDLSFLNTKEETNVESSISYAKKFKAFGINLDLGQQWLRYDLFFDQKMRVRNDYLFLIPKLSLNFTPLTGLDIGVSYKFAQEAPNIWSLNPNLRVSADRLTVWFGNPNLDSEKSHNVELSSGFYLGKFNIGLTGFYRTSNNAIVQFSQVNNEGTRERTYANNGNYTRTGLDLSISGSLQKWMKLDMSVSVFDSRMNQNQTFDQQIVGYNGNIQANFFLPKNWSLRASFQYNGPQLDIQGVNVSYTILRASIRKNLWNDKLNVSLSFDDITRSVVQGGDWSDPAFEVSSRSQFFRPYVNLRLNYRFGKLKEMPKSSKAGRQQ